MVVDGSKPPSCWSNPSFLSVVLRRHVDHLPGGAEVDCSKAIKAYPGGRWLDRQAANGWLYDGYKLQMDANCWLIGG